MTAGTTAPVLPIHQAIRDVLEAIASGDPTDFSAPYLGVYDGFVPEPVPLDSDGGIRTYAVLFAGTGDPTGDTLCGAAPAVNYRFGVNAVGADPDRCLWARDRVMGALVGLSLTGGVVRFVTATSPVPRTDAGGRPRHTAALLFNVLTT